MENYSVEISQPADPAREIKDEPATVYPVRFIVQGGENELKVSFFFPFASRGDAADFAIICENAGYPTTFNEEGEPDSGLYKIYESAEDAWESFRDYYEGE